ncbi:MAG: glycosyltransferase family 2 protein [Roseburia sp.]|nr:glycosyltransferase family 2 protein [Roseburia sp.]
MEKILLIIPAYNEAENIPWVIEELQQLDNVYDYVIINDGSKDNTKAICEEKGYNYVDMPINVGLADVFRTGMKYAVRHGYSMALQYDGDGQHDPHYIACMVEKMKQTNADVVIGSRFVEEKGCKSLRNVGSYIIQALIKLTTGKRISDPTSGMRLYNANVMKFLANEINMAPEPDTIALLIRQGFRVEEVEVKMRERQAGVSYLNFGNSIRYMMNICMSLVFIQWFRRKR